MIEINKVYCQDNLQFLKTLPDKSIDMVIGSPPYSSIRAYKSLNKNFDTRSHLLSLGPDIYRVLKDGGICALVLQDQTVKGHKTLSTFGTIMDWCQNDNIRFNLFECLIYNRRGAPGAFWLKRFRVDHEYIPIFLKGNRPKHFDKSHILIPVKTAGKHLGGTRRQTSGVLEPYNKDYIVKDKTCCGTIFKYSNSSQESYNNYGIKDLKIAKELKVSKLTHPATFPFQLCKDIIMAFCPKNSVVLDLWVGSGETAIAAQLSGRNWVGVDIENDYVDLARKRLSLLPTNVY